MDDLAENGTNGLRMKIASSGFYHPLQGNQWSTAWLPNNSLYKKLCHSVQFTFQTQESSDNLWSIQKLFKIAYLFSALIQK